MFSIYDVIALILKEEGCDVISPLGSRLYKRKELDNSLKLCCNSEQFSILRQICLLLGGDLFIEGNGDCLKFANPGCIVHY